MEWVKKKLHQHMFEDYVHEREVWWCSVGVNVGTEQDGKNDLYERPVLILRKFSKETVLVVPLTSRRKNGNYYCMFQHNAIIHTAILLGLREISTRRLQRRMYTLNDVVYNQIKLAVVGLIMGEEKIETPA